MNRAPIGVDDAVLVAGDYIGSANFGGETFEALGDVDNFLLELGPGGQHVGSRVFGGYDSDHSHGLAVSPTGAIALTGSFYGTTNLGGPLIARESPLRRLCRRVRPLNQPLSASRRRREHAATNVGCPGRFTPGARSCTRDDVQLCFRSALTWPRVCALIGAIAGTLCLPAAASAGDYTKTKHPIVLAHGMSGFDDLFGIYEYWQAIPQALSKDGAKVFVTEVPQFNSTEARGEALLAQVEEIVAVTGATRVNLIGHSHGGLDVRYVASVAPQLVASVTTIGSPHHGAELADFLRTNVKGGGFTESVLGLFANSLGSVLSLLSGASNQQDAIAGLGALTSEGLSLFNAAHPAGLPATWCGEGAAVVGGVRYYSWTGTRALTNILDPSDALLGLTSVVYAEDNDGLVGRCSAHLGKVIRDDYRLNHLDEVNQAFGLVHLFGPDPKTLFRTHANRLKNEGL